MRDHHRCAIVYLEQYRGARCHLKNGFAVQKLLNYFRLSGGVRRSSVLSTPVRGDDQWKPDP